MSPDRTFPLVPAAPRRHGARVLLPLIVAGTALLGATAAQADTTVELSAEASRTAPNDLARASVFTEASGTTPGEPGKQVNAKLAEALRLAKSYGAVQVQSGGTQTYPTYGKNGKVEGWRVRSELQLESADPAAMSELLGKLQGANLGLGALSFVPSPSTRAKAEDAATEEAIAAFKERAKRISATLGQPYKIKQLSVSSHNRMPGPMFRMAAPMAADVASAPMPVEAGQSQVTVTVSGQIELDK